MTKKFSPLEGRLKQYYNKKALPLDTLLDLKTMIADESITHEQSSQPVSIKYQTFLRPAVAVAFAMACLALAVFAFQLYTEHNQLESIAAEIALNHAKRFNTEFTPINIASLTNEMHLLDFAPVHPRRMQLDPYHIVGARYCTIDSSIAVQVHLEDEAEEAYTLYEFRESDSVSIGKETVIDVGDIRVTLWQEGEVVMGLAQRAN
ncbi:MAG: hypothetical protein AAF485_05145 [Chloroflexota bacterium]